MLKEAEREISSTHKSAQGGEDDFFVRITVTPGPKFYGGKRHDTHHEIGEVLEAYAKSY
jgi:hypothetical protein